LLCVLERLGIAYEEQRTIAGFAPPNHARHSAIRGPGEAYLPEEILPSKSNVAPVSLPTRPVHVKRARTHV
jgi:hypothetical protein